MTINECILLAFKFAGLTLLGFGLSWLLIEARLFKAPRDWLILTCRKKGWIEWEYWLGCPWCFGFWAQVLMVVAISRWEHVSLPLIALWPFAINAVTAPVHLFVDKYLN